MPRSRSPLPILWKTAPEADRIDWAGCIHPAGTSCLSSLLPASRRSEQPVPTRIGLKWNQGGGYARRRLFRGAIANQARSLCDSSGGSVPAATGWTENPNLPSLDGSPGCEIFFDVDFLDQGHCRSGRSVQIPCGLYWGRKGWWEVSVVCSALSARRGTDGGDRTPHRDLRSIRPGP